jgi:hypothetical protein
MTQHLAQFNIARIRYPLDDPRFGWERIPAAQLWKTARCAETSGQAA